ncbi:MAG: hypothetical protein JWN63_2823 [Candidatus Acidoferrum typicum]|nr:hypothetical protein [Candidatus Acidoferrum typicum]
MRALKAKRRPKARKGEAKLLRHPAAPMYSAKTSMHPMLRRMLGEILVIELELDAKGVLGGQL